MTSNIATTVVCVKVKPHYTPEYVNRLASMLWRHAARPMNFLCLTDDPTGLECDYADVGADLPGWWSKLILFKPGVFDERVIYLDLDTVIVGNVDFLFEYAGPFAVLRSFLPPSRYGSAIMSIAPGFGRHIWERFTPDVMKRLYGDQDWIEEQVAKADFWQDVAPGKIGSYKVDGLHESPKEFSLCCFHGTPKPHEVDGWVADEWR